MPTSYTTTVTVDGYASANYGSQLDSLEITTGSTNPYELPQPPSARASFLGLPVVSGVTQTPDWWIGKKLTFTIAPQGATGTVTWAGIVQGYNCSPVQTSSADQIVELDLLGATSRLSTELIYGTMDTNGEWKSLYLALNKQLESLTWAEAPVGLKWNSVTTTWANYNNNKSGLTFSNTVELQTTSLMDNFITDIDGTDLLSFITGAYSNFSDGWFWFDDTNIYLYQPSVGLPSWPTLTSLNAQSCVLWSSLGSSQSFGNIINAGKLENYNASETYTYSDGTSISSYGYRFVDFGSTYSTYAGVSTLADRINAYKNPNKYLQSLTINLDAMTHVTGQWQNFYKSTKPVLLPLTNIPTAYGGNHTYLVRGVQLNLTRKHAEATLIVVPSTIYNPS